MPNTPHPGWLAVLGTAFRANLIPGLVVQAVGLVIVVAYYQSPAFATTLTAIGDWKVAQGLWATLAITAVNGGLLPLVAQGLLGRHGWRDHH